MQPAYYDADGITIFHGDTLDVLAELQTPVAAVITDPPYASGSRLEASKSSSGAMLRAGRFADRPIELDQMTTTGFVWLMRAVGMAVRPMLPDGGGSLLSFIDWRQWPNLTGALETCNYRIQGMIVWGQRLDGVGQRIPLATRTRVPRIERRAHHPRQGLRKRHHTPPRGPGRPPLAETS